MRMLTNITTAVLALISQMVFAAASAQAAIDNAGVMDDLLQRYSAAVDSWESVVVSAASWLFWILVLISMVWTFGMLALRKADIGDFFGEFVRFTAFVGFFWWLLSNGSALADAIFESLRQLGGDATGLGPGLSPSGVVDIGFAIFDRVLDQSLLWSPVDAAIGITLAGIILVLLALVSIKMVLLLVAGWVLAFGGVFFLGFGGSRWTSGFAVSYFKVVLALAAQLMTMVLLVGIGKTFLDDYRTSMRAGISLHELGVMLIVALILFTVINRIPPLIASVITGARIGGEGAGAPVTGTALAPMSSPSAMAMTAATTGGAAIAAGAANAAAGAQSLMAAFSNANQNVPVGVDLRDGLSGTLARYYSGSTYGRGLAVASQTPFAAAAGFNGGTLVGDLADTSFVGGSYGGGAWTERTGGPARRNEEPALSKISTARQGRRNRRPAEGGSLDGAMPSSGMSGVILSGVGAGWVNQTGGFVALSAEDQQQARAAYAEWQSHDPDNSTLGLEDYVSEAQGRQQAANDEAADFIQWGRPPSKEQET